MSDAADDRARRFAVDVVDRLRSAGFEAVWAGGCVRDQLLGRPPKDYDVATSATPEQIRDVFSKRKTLAVGAAFGVITVLGPRGVGQIDVATFRRDAEYSDGRHPDSVSFSNAREDAARRDFTINGLFYDPIEERVIDYVGGRDDLQARVVRAIGSAGDRIAEDKLRMLRAVRFAATYRFTIDPATAAAIQQHAAELTVVSGERIASEMRRMLGHACRADALRLLAETDLLNVVVPEVADLAIDATDPTWQATLSLLAQLETDEFATGLAALVYRTPSTGSAAERRVADISNRWKLSGDERQGTWWLLQHVDTILAATTTKWPTLQRLLVVDGTEELIRLAAAITSSAALSQEDLQFCRDKLALPARELNPEPLISGDDLLAEGIPQGPAFAQLLRAVRDAQLERSVQTSADALALARRLFAEEWG